MEKAATAYFLLIICACTLTAILVGGRGGFGIFIHAAIGIFIGWVIFVISAVPWLFLHALIPISLFREPETTEKIIRALGSIMMICVSVAVLIQASIWSVKGYANRMLPPSEHFRLCKLNEQSDEKCWKKAFDQSWAD